MKNLLILAISLIISNASFAQDGSVSSEIDTIKVVLLVSDTSKNKLFTIKGYEVRNVTYRMVDVSVNPNYEISPGSVTVMGWIPIYEKKAFYSYLMYLDADKKKLSNNIIVWQSVENKNNL